MAQVAVAHAPANRASLTAEELRELLEYERIVQFRDAVLAGNHPRVKAPSHLAGKQLNARNVSTPIQTIPRAGAQPVQSTRNAEPSTPYNNNKTPNNQRAGGAAYIPMSTSSEINPILLEKSDDLIKAEIQLQRQKLERALREQIEQQRIAAKALLQTSESLPNFDLSEVLSKALAIVHPSPPMAEAAPSVGARSSASDSFDDNTFYSSAHSSIEPSGLPRESKEPATEQLYSTNNVGERPVKNHAAHTQVDDREVVMTGTSLSNNNHVSRQSMDSPAQQQTATDMGQSSRPQPSQSVEHSGQGSIPGLQESLQVAESSLRQAMNNTATSPVVYAHNLSPIAPQPARVSPLATAREPPVLRVMAPADEAQPAQVAALRNQPTTISSSTDSSPKGKGPEKKKKEKKKKRKGNDNAEAPNSPYIKTEPRSPSPCAGVAPLPQPRRRQRQSGQYAAELNYDEPRAQSEEIAQEPLPGHYDDGRAPQLHQRVGRFESDLRRPESVYRRLDRDEGYRRVSDGQLARRPESPAVFAVPYATGEARPVRAGSHAIVERRPYEEARYYREPVREAVMRASVRPDADRSRSRSPVMRERLPVAMAPPRQTMRIMIDEYGRKFYEPAPANSTRQSVAPPPRYREPEILYERAPPRPAPSRGEVYEGEDGVLYRRPSPSISMPRRVVTDSEYVTATPDYRSYRQREYSVRPSAMGPPSGGYVETRGPPARREMSHYEEAQHEYVRAASVRPGAEPVRYEIPREYVGRLQSVRPEAPPREYAASVRPEAQIIPAARSSLRQEMEYAAPIRAGSVYAHPPREHMAAPDGQGYYEEAPRGRPAQVAYIEQPRAREGSVVVYADSRREMYR